MINQTNIVTFKVVLIIDVSPEHANIVKGERVNSLDELEQYVTTELGWSLESFEGFEIKSIKKED